MGEALQGIDSTAVAARVARRGYSFGSAASFFTKLSYFVGGLAGLGALAGVGAAILGDKYGDPFRSHVKTVHGWAPAWHWAVITAGAYVILYRLIVGTLGRMSIRALGIASAVMADATGRPQVASRCSGLTLKPR